MKITTHLFNIWAFCSLSTTFCFAQIRDPAVDSMGVNIGRQNWKAAIDWALKAAETNPAEKYWRYLNVADFASRDHNADLAIQYTALVLDSDIAIKTTFGNNFDWLLQDPRWRQLMAKLAAMNEKQRQQRIEASLPFRHNQTELLAQTTRHIDSLAKIQTANQLYKQIQQTGSAHHYYQTDKYQSGWLTFADSLEFPFVVQLPAGFDASKRYPMIVVLHGAVGRQTQLPDVADSTAIPFFGTLFAEQASRSDIIAVFPYSTRRYNWMMPDDGFELIPQLVRQVKKMYPVDDRRVYVAGHSNGATGAFSYLMKQPSLFAGFAGINNRPQVRTGGTFFQNGINRSFYNVATDYDYYFPLEGHRAITELAKRYNIDWQNQEVSGHRNHGYLIRSMDSSVVEIYQQLFTDLLTKQRNPFQNNLYWECDDVRNGRCDWLELNQLDTLKQKAKWHTEVNTPVSGWRENAHPEILLDSISSAFVFPRQSGAVQATYSKNRFELKTSRVKSVTIYLSPEMVDFDRPIRVVINGKEVHNTAVKPDRSFVLAGYLRDLDHQAIWANRLQFEVP